MPLFLLLVLLLSPTLSSAHELKTPDGLSLQISDAGRVTGMRVGEADLPLAGAGGFFVADVAKLPNADQQLVPNPGFEDVQDGQPTGWGVGADWTRDTTVHRNGAAAMHVSIPGDKKRNSGSLGVEVAVQPNTSYRASLWLRTAGSAPSMYVVQMDAGGATRPEFPQKCISHANKQSDWFELGHSFVTAPFCRKVRVYTNIWDQTGEAWVDDVTLTCVQDDYVTPQQPASGTVQATPEGLRQTCDLRDLSLRLQATARVHGDNVEISGEVEDTSGQDRALTLSYRLPVDGTGWTWHDDLRNSVKIEPGVTYGAARPFGERRMIGLYPFAAMGDDQSALTLALPMDMPRVFRFCFEQGKGFLVNYEFALTRATAKFPSRASFRFLISRADPQWGFRSAARRYYAAFPQFFERRLPGQADAGFMQDLAAFANPERAAPAAAIWSWQKRAALDAYRRELVKLYSYTEFSGWWGWAIGITPELAKDRPTPEQAWAKVKQLAAQDPPNSVAQCILNCNPQDRDGRPVLHGSYNAAWGGYNYVCNPDPEIKGLGGGDVNRHTLTAAREVAPIATFKLDGMYFDCVFVFAVDNFRREHFQWADNPLAFDHMTKRPCLPLAFSIYECAKTLADERHALGQTVMSNYSVTDFPTDLFCVQFIDLVGNETLWTWTTDAKLSLQRVLAYQKPISMSWQEAKTSWAPERIERELKQAMFHGTFYNLSNLSLTVHDKWVPLTARLASAGWEPVTYAHVSEPGMIERFGSVAGGSLHFTLRNPTDKPATAKLELDAPALQLPATGTELWVARGAWSFEPLAVQRGAGVWTAEVPVPANDTVVVRVVARVALALDMLPGAAEALHKAMNYQDALQKAGAKVACPAYAEITPELQALAVALREGKAGEAQLRDLAAKLTTPTAEGLTGEPTTWLAYLTRCTAQA
ncbi:MAG: hypothetical protein KKI08_28235, partial [Armatimonadetes bacterium]|nr:hypothetical protein [Armatimonadota bacterium]